MNNEDRDTFSLHSETIINQIYDKFITLQEYSRLIYTDYVILNFLMVSVNRGSLSILLPIELGINDFKCYIMSRHTLHVM